jgi:hypothetical protein
MLQYDPVLALSALAEIYRTARTLWPLTEGAAEGTSKTVLVGGLTRLRPIQLTGSANWKLRPESEQTAVV